MFDFIGDIFEAVVDVFVDVVEAVGDYIVNTVLPSVAVAIAGSVCGPFCAAATAASITAAKGGGLGDILLAAGSAGFFEAGGFGGGGGQYSDVGGANFINEFVAIGSSVARNELAENRRSSGSEAAKISSAIAGGGTSAHFGGPKFENAASISPSHDRLYNDRAAANGSNPFQSRLDALEKNYLMRAALNPNTAIEITQADFELIIDYYRDQILRMPKQIAFGKAYRDQFNDFDTFLYDHESLRGHSFNVGGVLDSGGNINYIGIGMLAASYRQTLLLPAMVTTHNLIQWWKDEGFYNLKQIGTGTRWAIIGATEF